VTKTLTSRDMFDGVDWRRVHLHGRGARGAGRAVRRAVLLASGGRAVTLGNHVFLPDGADDDVALLAHELTHCAQYQAWGAWRYFSRGAAAQARELLHRALGVGASPYRYTIEAGKPWDAYGMEQQAQIIEDQIRRSPPTAPEHSRPDRRPSP
jgi:hypothetical protein